MIPGIRDVGGSGLALLAVGLPVVHVIHVLGGLSGLAASAFLSHSSLSFPKSLKKKLTMLQETLNLPPVDTETVNRLVLERFVDFLGCTGVISWKNSPERVFTTPGFGWVGGPCGCEGCGPPALRHSQDVIGKQL